MAEESDVISVVDRVGNCRTSVVTSNANPQSRNLPAYETGGHHNDRHHGRGDRCLALACKRTNATIKLAIVPAQGIVESSVGRLGVLLLSERPLLVCTVAQGPGVVWCRRCVGGRLRLDGVTDAEDEEVANIEGRTATHWVTIVHCTIAIGDI